MAHVSTSPVAGHGILHSITNIFAAIGRSLTMIPEANAKMRQIEDLSAMSDAELERRGLRREDIVRHVFGGSFL